jgi:hypothetical protein
MTLRGYQSKVIALPSGFSWDGCGVNESWTDARTCEAGEVLGRGDRSMHNNAASFQMMQGEIGQSRLSV